MGFFSNNQWTKTTTTRTISQDELPPAIRKRFSDNYNKDNSEKANLMSFERIKQIIAEQLDVEENKIQMSSRLIEDLGANYRDKGIVLDLIGEEFNVRFLGKKISTVGDIINLIGTYSNNVVENRVVSEDYSRSTTFGTNKSMNEPSPQNFDVFSRVSKILVNQLDVEYAEIKPLSSIVDDLGADSLDFVELVMAFEDEFNIEIPDKDAEKIKTVVDIVRYIDPSYNLDDNGILKHNVSEDYVLSRLKKSGRKIKKVSDYL